MTYLRRFTTLHTSSAAHFADQWAGQLEEIQMGRGEREEEETWETVKEGAMGIKSLDAGELIV